MINTSIMLFVVLCFGGQFSLRDLISAYGVTVQSGVLRFLYAMSALCMVRVLVLLSTCLQLAHLCTSALKVGWRKASRLLAYLRANLLSKRYRVSLGVACCLFCIEGVVLKSVLQEKKLV